MKRKATNWARWNGFFKQRRERPLPRLVDDINCKALPRSLAKSLAIFQLGESGGGTVVEQAKRSKLDDVDEHYARALQLFVAEEHRHANLLAMCVRMLGGELIRSNWTARLFVFARRLMGLRLKVLVLLAAEVVGICYYHMIATRLPASTLKELLTQIVHDERAHLQFHCAFLRTQARGPISKMVFQGAWRLTMFAAAITVIIDHREAIRDLGLSIGAIWNRWMTYSRLAERLVLDERRSRDTQDSSSDGHYLVTIR